MCKLKSGIILKDRVFVPNYDSHNAMLEELGIADTRENAEKLFVRAEFSPKMNNPFKPLETWEYVVDQDILPDWYVEEIDKERFISEVKRWANKHIVTDADIVVRDGIFYAKNSTVTAWANSKVEAFGNCEVYAFNNSVVTAWNNSTVEANDNSNVTVHGMSKVRSFGHSTVKALEFSTVEAWDHSKVEAFDHSKVSAQKNTMVTACGASAIHAYDSTVEAHVLSVVMACGDSNVKVWEGSNVTAYNQSTVIIESLSNAPEKNVDINDNSVLVNHRDHVVKFAWEERKK